MRGSLKSSTLCKKLKKLIENYIVKTNYFHHLKSKTNAVYNEMFSRVCRAFITFTEQGINTLCTINEQTHSVKLENVQCK